MRTYFAELYQRRVLEPLNMGKAPSLRSELIAAHAAGSLFGLISWWLAHDLSPSAEDMGNLYWGLMTMDTESMIRQRGSTLSLPS